MNFIGRSCIKGFKVNHHLATVPYLSTFFHQPLTCIRSYSYIWTIQHYCYNHGCIHLYSQHIHQCLKKMSNNLRKFTWWCCLQIYLSVWNCLKLAIIWRHFIPLHVFPSASRLNPFLQAHLYDPSAFKQISEQSPFLTAHSSTSKQSNDIH